MHTKSIYKVHRLKMSEYFYFNIYIIILGIMTVVADENNGSQQYTRSSLIGPTNWKPSKSTLSKKILNGNIMIDVKMPDEQYPINYKSSEPYNITLKEVEEIQLDVLAKSNYYRDMHKMPRLALHEQVSNYAQEWANFLAKNNQLKQRPYNETDEISMLYGQIIDRTAKYLYPGELAVDSWYRRIVYIEIKDTNDSLNKNTNIADVTQLLWKRSAHIGVGVAVDGKSHTIIVANFHPKGNIPNFHLENLPSITQKQIDEALMLQNSIFVAKRNPVNAVQNGKLPIMPGWKTQLIRESQMTSELEKTNLNLPNSNGILKEPIPNSFSDENNWISIMTQSHQKIIVGLPNEHAPIDYKYSEPFGLTSAEVENIRNNVHEKTNIYRRKYNIPQLVINEEINNYAQEWANYLANVEKLKIRPKVGKAIRYGETVYGGLKALNNGELSVDMWYSFVRLMEVNDNDYKLRSKKVSGSVMQLLWKQTMQMGIGAAMSKYENIYIVVNYNPGASLTKSYLENLPIITQEDILKAQDLFDRLFR